MFMRHIIFMNFDLLLIKTLVDIFYLKFIFSLQINIVRKYVLQGK